MTEEEKVRKIRGIYQQFLLELESLKKQANQRTQQKIKDIEDQKIDQLLEKINREF